MQTLYRPRALESVVGLRGKYGVMGARNATLQLGTECGTHVSQKQCCFERVNFCGNSA